jgi:hypothetical protein
MKLARLFSLNFGMAEAVDAGIALIANTRRRAKQQLRRAFRCQRRVRAAHLSYRRGEE